MKATTVILVSLIVAITGLVLLHLRVHLLPLPTLDSDKRSKSENENHGAMLQLANIIRIQNETITLLEGVLDDRSRIPDLPSKTAERRNIADIMSQLHQLQNDMKAKGPKEASSVDSQLSSISIRSDGLGTSKSSTSLLIPKEEGLEKECSMKYGLELVDEWRQNKEIWCDNNDVDAAMKSKLTCYPYHQKHKILDGRGPDLFCEAENFLIDFTKVHGSASNKKPQREEQYLEFDPGSLSASCSKTEFFKNNLFMPHHQLQMSTFVSAPSFTLPPVGSYEAQDTPTYLLARDEDCENSFHSTADFMNMFLVLTSLELEPKNLQVMLFDKHTDGPYIDLVQKAFSPNHPVIRPNNYKNQKVLFKHLVFHLESPAGLIFPKVSNPDPLRCYNTGLFQGYRKFVLHAFGLLHVPPPAIPTVTLSLRHRTEQKNVGRVLKNENEVVDVLKEGNMMNINVVDTAKMSFSDQLALIRRTNILVGVHGAGLMFIMFAAEEAILIEIHPSYRQDRHFRHAARMTAKIYMPMRSKTRESCVDSSDDVVVPIEEFRAVIDGAVRIARSFDDGLSECGLVCPPSILALDPRLDPLYAQLQMVKGKPLDTSFPCY